AELVAPEDQLSLGMGRREEEARPLRDALERREDPALPGHERGTAFEMTRIVGHEGGLGGHEMPAGPARQQAELGEDLEAVADAGDDPAAPHELLELRADRGPHAGGENRPGPHVISRRE